MQHFRGLGQNDAAYILKTMNEDPEIGGELRKFLVNPNEKLPQVSKAECLAFILDRDMTRIDWEETCKLVNEPGNYRLPSYNVLSLEKQKTRPRGKHLPHLLTFKSKLHHLRQVSCFSMLSTL